MESRFYENTLSDAPLRENDFLVFDKCLKPELKSEIDAIFQKLYAVFESMRDGGDKDVTVYSGTAGIAYLRLLLSGLSKRDGDLNLEKGLVLLERSIPNLMLGTRELSFLCGEVGTMCVYAVMRLKFGASREAHNLANKVLNMLPGVLDPGSDIPNELLYGRVGYLYSLLFLGRYFYEMPATVIKQVVNVVIEQGRQAHHNYLMWKWHGEKYFGGAHGVAGIVYMLLQAGEYSEEQKKLLENTVDYLLSQRFPSGNLPSSYGSKTDKLVHWCHGAPGFVQMLLAAYEVWKKPEYFAAAEKCGEVVWERGLLRKGCGICHGVAGNGYTFIALYQVTRNEMHLRRALQFARWCASFNDRQAHAPQRPKSLFEGLAGTLYFLADIQKPLEAMFPCYSVKPFTKCV